MRQSTRFVTLKGKEELRKKFQKLSKKVPWI